MAKETYSMFVGWSLDEIKQYLNHVEPAPRVKCVWVNDDHIREAVSAAVGFGLAFVVSAPAPINTHANPQTPQNDAQQ